MSTPDKAKSPRHKQVDFHAYHHDLKIEFSTRKSDSALPLSLFDFLTDQALTFEVSATRVGETDNG